MDFYLVALNIGNIWWKKIITQFEEGRKLGGMMAVVTPKVSEWLPSGDAMSLWMDFEKKRRDEGRIRTMEDYKTG